MSDRAIQETIQILAGTHLSDKVYAVDATVVSVDESKRNCIVRVISGKANNEFTARLMCAIDDGVLVIPLVDSTVSIVMSDFTTPYVSQYSGIEKIVLRGGDLGGLVKVIELTEKLNNLEQLLNDLVTKYNSHTHSGVSTGGGMSGVTTALETGTLTPTQRSEIENEQITHG